MLPAQKTLVQTTLPLKNSAVKNEWVRQHWSVGPLTLSRVVALNGPNSEKGIGSVDVDAGLRRASHEALRGLLIRSPKALGASLNELGPDSLTPSSREAIELGIHA